MTPSIENTVEPGVLPLQTTPIKPDLISDMSPIQKEVVEQK